MNLAARLEAGYRLLLKTGDTLRWYSEAFGGEEITLTVSELDELIAVATRQRNDARGISAVKRVPRDER